MEGHARLYGKICGRLGEGDKGILAEFDFTGEALAAFRADNSYIQGFADGMVFMGLFKKIVLIDGRHLAQLMIDYDIGVSQVVTRMDLDYFGEE